MKGIDYNNFNKSNIFLGGYGQPCFKINDLISYENILNNSLFNGTYLTKEEFPEWLDYNTETTCCKKYDDYIITYGSWADNVYSKDGTHLYIRMK